MSGQDHDPQILNAKIKSMERERFSCFQKLYNQGYIDIEVLRDIQEDKSDFTLNKRLHRIQAGVGDIQNLINNPQSGLQYISTLKSLMEFVESEIMIFKTIQKQELQELFDYDKSISQELKSLQERLTNGDQNLARPILFQKNSNVINQTSGLLPDVIAFQEFASKYGHEGGWDPTNHATFIKYTLQYHNDLEKLFRICSRLPGITYQMVKDHYRWFQIYTKKLELNKLAIKKWKETKQNFNHAQIQSELNAIESIEAKKKPMVDDKTRELKKFEILLWKKNQKEKKEMEELQKRKQLELEQQLNRKRILQRNQTIQNQNKSIDVKKLDKPMPQVPTKPKPLITKSISQLQLQDQQWIQKRKSKQSELIQKEIDKQTRLNKLKENVRVHVNRDPERLFQPTFVTRKKMELDESECVPVVQYHIQSRTVPTWRQGL
ncbi:hypothetical protein HDV02_002574 [Globomyces sp. JEL0801]|nr:hypothetical protein HDV02_002574 [Globomyces sp. JEL0801]